jgi:hypothetical protein
MNSAKEPSRVERIKEASAYLRGTLEQGLRAKATGAISEDDAQLVKFHGMYLQDDRDLRGERAKKKMEKAFAFMIRVRFPGGICTSVQWHTLARVARDYANGTVRLTTRQSVQLHGVIKSNLKSALAAIDAALLSTIAACGDVNRNVMCNPNPFQSRAHEAALNAARAISEHLTPRTPAYREIWLDGERIAGGEPDVVEPIYGKTYLPRKFKIAVAVPPSNDVDVYAHDLSFIAVLDRSGDVAGFNVLVGGGMGMTPIRAPAIRSASAGRRTRSGSPRRSSPCSATGATGRTASMRASNIPSRITALPCSAPRSNGASAGAWASRGRSRSPRPATATAGPKPRTAARISRCSSRTAGSGIFPEARGCSRGFRASPRSTTAISGSPPIRTSSWRMSRRNAAKQSKRWSRNTDWERPARACGAMRWRASRCRPAASRSPRASAICRTSSPRSTCGSTPTGLPTTTSSSA